MAYAGQTIENPVTKERITFRATRRDTGGKYFQMETALPPGGFVAARHVHPYQQERFEVLQGTARFRIGDIERDAPAGEVLTAPPGIAHTFWNPGQAPIRVLSEYRPALDLTEAFFENYFGLARDGKTNNKGTISNPFHLAVLGAAYSDYVRLASPPWPVQRAFFAFTAPIGRILGYRARDQRYSHESGPT